MYSDEKFEQWTLFWYKKSKVSKKNKLNLQHKKSSLHLTKNTSQKTYFEKPLICDHTILKSEQGCKF